VNIKLDENVHGDVAAALTAQGHDVATVRDQGLAGRPDADTATRIIGFFAVVLGTANVVGGFVVTDRMLEMFKRKPSEKQEAE